MTEISMEEPAKLWKNSPLPVYNYFGNLGRNAAIEEDVVRPGELKPTEEDIDVGFWNVEWLTRNPQKIPGVARFIAEMNLDVWGMEETSPEATRKLVDLLKSAYGLDFDFGVSEPDAPAGKQSCTVIWNKETVTGAKVEWPAEIEEVLRLSSKGDLSPIDALEEAVDGKIFDRYPGLFLLKAKANPELDFYLIPLHLKAMSEGSKRRRLACRVLAAAMKRMREKYGATADWILGGDMNAPLESGDFDNLADGGLTAVSAQDAEDGAFSYIKGPRSLIDHIYISKNLAEKFEKGDFNVIAAEKEIPKWVYEISDHRPVMLRVQISSDDITEATRATRGMGIPDWLKSVASPTDDRTSDEIEE